MLGHVVQNLPADAIGQVAQHGSPMLLRALGRAVGLGQDEQAALGQGAVPWWLYGVIGVGLGVFVGVQLQKRWPEKVEFLGGGR